MKRIKFVWSLFIGVLAFNTQAQVDKVVAPIMTFEKTLHDWGTINEGEIVETDFVFTNTGKTDLIITRIKGSCGCTVPSNWKREPIAPGETSKFHVKFNSKHKPNRQLKTVTVTCNTVKGRESVRIKAQVIPNPEMEKNRAERAAKRKVIRAQRLKERQAIIDAEKNNTKKIKGKSIVKKENKNTTYTDEKKIEKIQEKEERKRGKAEKKLDKQRKKAEKRAEKKEKELKREEKNRKRELKKAEKARKKAEKARKKAEKIAKKQEKLQKAVKKATIKVEKLENKLVKMQSRFDKLESKGKLSPNDITKRQLDMQKQVDKINKAKRKLQKAQHKL